MADGYWGRQPPTHPSAPMVKRPRPDYDLLPGAAPGQESFPYLSRDDNRAGYHSLKDTRSIEESYERYLQNSQRTSFGPGEASNFSGSGVGRPVGGGMPDLAGGMQSLPYGDSVMMGGPGPRAVGPDMIANGRGMNFAGDLPLDAMVRQGPPGREMPLPPDASNTLFVEGLPRDITQREVAHIFRPFLGYKEVRIVTKEPKYHSADPMVLCFVDFTDALCAMRALTAVQGYKIDEKDPDSPVLRMQFSRYPGPRPSYGARSKSAVSQGALVTLAERMVASLAPPLVHLPLW